MAELYDPAAHQPLVDAVWDESRVRAEIAAIVADAEAWCDGVTWPKHPRDDFEDAEPAPTTLYLGSAGMCWALRALGSSLDVSERALERWREQHEFGDVPSLWMGETGLLLVTRSDDERLRERIHENRANPTWELMWGSSGTMLAAVFAGFDDLWRESAELLWEQWDPESCLWLHDLYGSKLHILGPAHGFAGNVHALRGFRDDDELRVRVAVALESTALRDGPLVTWPSHHPKNDKPVRAQWCHGAPGIVATIGDLMPPELALAGGELTWAAGPLAKGANLCHGTAGNGYAFLKLFGLTGDELWLDRARRFAMHAIAQVEAERAELGRGRFSLWTGDVGTALYLQSCLDADPRVPTIDVW